MRGLSYEDMYPPKNPRRQTDMEANVILPDGSFISAEIESIDSDQATVRMTVRVANQDISAVQGFLTCEPTFEQAPPAWLWDRDSRDEPFGGVNVTRQLLRTLRDWTGHPPTERINAHIRADLEKRATKGVATYGEELHSDNGRDALIDLYEELLDAYQYAYQYQIEAPVGQRADRKKHTVNVRRALESVIEALDERRGGIGFLE